MLKEELGIKDLPAQVKVGDARSWAIAARLTCVVCNANSATAMLNLCCPGSRAELEQLQENDIEEATRPVGCCKQKLVSILLYVSLTVEEMEARLQADGAQWLGKLGGLHGMGDKTTAVINTYYKASWTSWLTRMSTASLWTPKWRPSREAREALDIRNAMA